MSHAHGLRRPEDHLPDVRDGLTRVERIVLVCLHEAQRERGGRDVPTAMLYGRVVEHAVERLPGDRVRVHFKRPSRAGATHADMSTDRFLARLCALVPPPRVNTIRYYGVFANRHHLRSRIVPDPALAKDGVPPPPRQLDLFGARPLADTDAAAASTSAHGTADNRPRRHRPPPRGRSRSAPSATSALAARPTHPLRLTFASPRSRSSVAPLPSRSRSPCSRAGSGSVRPPYATRSRRRSTGTATGSARPSSPRAH